MKAAVHSLRPAALPIGIATASVIAGVLVTGQADLWLGKTPALLLIAALVGGTFFVFFSFLGSAAVIVWPIATTGGYLLQLPRSHPVITFDRAWIAGLLAYIALNQRRVARSQATRLLLLAMTWLAVSYGIRAFATAPGFSEPVRTSLDALVLPVILFVACERYCLRDPDRARRLCGSLMIGGGVLGAIGIAERIFGFELATLTGGTVRFDDAIDVTRISGPYPAPEPYALSLVICLAASFYWLLSRKPNSSYGWAVVLSIVQLAAIALALFRAGWIAALLVVIAIFGFRPARLGRAFTVTVFVAAVALAGTSQLQHNKTVAARLNDTQNIYGRLATYKEGVEIFRTSPLFGIGVSQYHSVAEKRPPATVAGTKAVTFPHSSYFGLLAEQGVVGVLPLLFLSYAVWRFIRRLRSVSVAGKEVTLLMGAVAGAGLGYLIMSLTLTMLPYAPPNAFFAVLLAAASARLDLVSEGTRGSTAGIAMASAAKAG
jgi:hypothetical protein